MSHEPEQHNAPKSSRADDVNVNDDKKMKTVLIIVTIAFAIRRQIFVSQMYFINQNLENCSFYFTAKTTTVLIL